MLPRPLPLALVHQLQGTYKILHQVLQNRCKGRFHRKSQLLLSNIKYHILEGVHFLLSGGSPSCWSAWARWVTRNQRELVTLFLASLTDTFALQQLTTFWLLGQYGSADFKCNTDALCILSAPVWSQKSAWA